MELKQTLINFFTWDRLKNVAVPVIGVLVGIFIGSLVVVSPDRPLFTIIGNLFWGAFGTTSNFAGSLVFAIPLGFTGLAIVMAFRTGILNIGAEGQLQLAAVAATLVAINTGFSSPFVHIFTAIIAGAAVGALWAFLPAVLKAYKGFNEIVVTMLMNYIAILFVSYLVQGPVKDQSQYFPQTKKIAETATLNQVVEGIHLHSGVYIFFFLVVVVYFVLFKTSFGFRMRAVGLNQDASRYAGIKVERRLVYAMLISGGLAGVAGSVEILGVHHRLLEGFSPGYGYDAIAVALLANLNPIGVIFSALFFGALRNAANNLQIEMGIPVAFIYVIQALAIMIVIGSQGMPRFIKNIKRRFSNV